MNNLPFKKIATSLLIATAFLTGFAHAELAVSPAMKQASYPASQLPSDESVERLMIVQQFDKTLEKSNRQTQTIVAQMLQKSFSTMPKNENLTPEQNAKIRQVTQNFIEDILKEQNSPANRLKFKNAFIASAKETYTQSEVDAMIAFYGSPIGQQITNKQSQFSQSYMQKIMTIVQEQQQSLIKDKLPILLKQMKEITGK